MLRSAECGILVFCHWVLSKINTNSEEKLNKFSMIFLTKGNQNKAKQNSFKVKKNCICFPLLSNFIGRGKQLLNPDICTVLCTDTHV